MGTALVIFLLLALCGFIAYIGDLLGRRLGKKRLSIFGLRPKHTAILLTIVTGVLIATVTFGAALAAVPGFRRAVMERERLVRANRTLRDHNHDLERQGAALSAQIGELSRKNGELAQTKEELSKKNEALTGESARLTTANKELHGKNTRLACDNARLVNESSELLKGNKELRQVNDGLRATNTRLSATKASLAADNGRLKARVKSMRAEQKTIEEKVTVLRLETDELKKEDYIVRRNQQIAFLPLPPNPPIDQLRTAVTNLLYEARHPMGQFEARHLELDPPEKYSGPTGDEAAIRDWIVRQAAAKRNQRLAIRLYATENAVKGRPIRATFECYANERVFAHGEKIAEKRVDGAGTLGSIMEELVFLLQSGVQGRAKAEGMKSGEKGLGEMTADQILAVCEQIREIKAPVQVVARARQDTYQSGPLNVDLEVSRIGSSEATRR